MAFNVENRQRIIFISDAVESENLKTLSKQYPNVVFFTNTPDTKQQFVIGQYNERFNIIKGGKKYINVQGINPERQSVLVGDKLLMLTYDSETGLIGLSIGTNINTVRILGIVPINKDDIADKSNYARGGYYDNNTYKQFSLHNFDGVYKYLVSSNVNKFALYLAIQPNSEGDYNNSFEFNNYEDICIGSSNKTLSAKKIDSVSDLAIDLGLNNIDHINSVLLYNSTTIQDLLDGKTENDNELKVKYQICRYDIDFNKQFGGIDDESSDDESSSLTIYPSSITNTASTYRLFITPDDENPIIANADNSNIPNIIIEPFVNKFITKQYEEVAIQNNAELTAFNLKLIFDNDNADLNELYTNIIKKYLSDKDSNGNSNSNFGLNLYVAGRDINDGITRFVSIDEVNIKYKELYGENNIGIEFSILDRDNVDSIITEVKLYRGVTSALLNVLHIENVKNLSSLVFEIKPIILNDGDSWNFKISENYAINNKYASNEFITYVDDNRIFINDPIYKFGLFIGDNNENTYSTIKNLLTKTGSSDIEINTNQVKHINSINDITNGIESEYVLSDNYRLPDNTGDYVYITLPKELYYKDITEGHVLENICLYISNFISYDYDDFGNTSTAYFVTLPQVIEEFEDVNDGIEYVLLMIDSPVTNKILLLNNKDNKIYNKITF